ncbi:MAG: hypothetical protein JXR76_20800 [Deltaproteobacteria bacterium]|nr:hypothetical protein [Deltaproteobacteria bacterium]
MSNFIKWIVLFSTVLCFLGCTQKGKTGEPSETDSEGSTESTDEKNDSGGVDTTATTDDDTSNSDTETESDTAKDTASIDTAIDDVKSNADHLSA